MHLADLVAHILREFDGGDGWCYRVLGMGLNPKKWEIRRIYFTLVKRLHPDKIYLDFDSKPGVKKSFHVLKEAYETLTDRPISKGQDGPIVYPPSRERQPSPNLAEKILLI